MMETALSNMMVNPWIFGVLFLLALVSAVPVIFRFLTAIWMLFSTLVTKGFGAARAWLVNSVKEQAVAITKSRFPAAAIGAKLLHALLYLGQVLFWGILLIAIQQVTSDGMLLSLIDAVSGGSLTLNYNPIPTIVSLSLFALFFFIFVGYTIFQLIVLATLGSIEHDEPIGE